MSTTPMRRIIQIATMPVSGIRKNEYGEGGDVITETTNGIFALCQDGTLWLSVMGVHDWQKIDNVPQPEAKEPTTPKPEGPGNRPWKSKQDEGSGD